MERARVLQIGGRRSTKRGPKKAAYDNDCPPLPPAAGVRTPLPIVTPGNLVPRLAPEQAGEPAETVIAAGYGPEICQM
jgi:hypothetical protein